tara:strand:+ start:12335 stop:14182 length:1848 start_codon:yes stop_codon:yes gene_type:complete
MAVINETLLTNTWEYWRQRQNETATRLSSISDTTDEIKILTDVLIGGTNNTLIGQSLNDSGRVARFGSTADNNGGGNKLNIDFKSIRHTAGNSWEETETKIEYNVDDDVDKKMWISFYNDSGTTTDNIMRFGEGAATEWARFDNGQLAIGTAVPDTDQLLHVAGNTTIDNTLTAISLIANTVALTDGDLTINATDIDKPINITNVDTVANTTMRSIFLTYNSSGADLVSGGNKSKIAFRIDGNYSATGGGVADGEQLNIYNSYITSTNSGDPYTHIAQYTLADTNHSAGDVSLNYGAFSLADALNPSPGTVTNNTGLRGLSRIRSSGDVTNTYGAHLTAYALNGSSASGTRLYGLVAEAVFEGSTTSNIANVRGGSFTIDMNDGTAGTAIGVYSNFDLEPDADVTGDAFLINGSYSAGSVARVAGTAYGIYMAGEANNYVSSNLTVGGDLNLVGNVTSALDVDDLATFTNGIDVTGTTTFRSGFTSLANVKLNDNIQLRLGTDNDAIIAHDGSNLILDLANDDAFYIRDSNSALAHRFIFYSATGNFTANGAVTGATLVGAGSAITALNGSNISTGTVADARIATTIARKGNGTTQTLIIYDSAGGVLKTINGHA